MHSLYTHTVSTNAVRGVCTHYTLTVSTNAVCAVCLVCVLCVSCAVCLVCLMCRVVYRAEVIHELCFSVILLNVQLHNPSFDVSQASHKNIIWSQGANKQRQTHLESIGYV
jgi:hypothetical protein